MMPLPFRTLNEMPSLRGKRVIVRGSLDVPIENGVVVNDFRIKKIVPTLKFLTSAGAAVIVITHVGRDKKNITGPIADVLGTYFPMVHTEMVVGAEVDSARLALRAGMVLLLGNLRRHPEEEANNEAFARTLASYADFYVNDAFAVSHRPHASIVGIPSRLPSFAGITFAEEYNNLARALTPEQPALFILGGAKFETKQPLIERYADSYETVALGGALANDFLKGRGFEVGTSLVSPVDLSKSPLVRRDNIVLPVDVVVKGERGVHEVAVEAVTTDEAILDIGMRSVDKLAPHIASAKTILWNGPLGYYEGGYDVATKACAKLIAKSEAFSVVGGGDTVAAIESLGLGDKFGFLSTAGGAMLEFLEKGTLPGIEALTKSQP